METYQRLEQRWAEFNCLDPRGMVACSSGTAALHLAVECVKGPNPYVLVPDYTMVACPRAVTLGRAYSVFVDCDKQLTLTADTIKEHVGPWRKAGIVMAVHTYGRKPYMPEIAMAVKPSGTQIIEDLAEAHGTLPHSETDAACWSFYKNKIVAGEEGGAVWFKNVEHADKTRLLRSLGFTAAHDYTHIPFGHNYRMSNLHAAAILESLDKIHENIARRVEVESWYDHYCPADWRQPKRNAVWVYDVRIPGMTVEVREKIVRNLQANDIAARFGFKPMTLQAEYLSAGNPETYRAYPEVLYLPVTPSTSQGDCRRAIDLIRAAYDSATR